MERELQNTEEHGLCALFRAACDLCDKISDGEKVCISHEPKEMFPVKLLNTLLKDEDFKKLNRHIQLEIPENAVENGLERARQVLDNSFLPSDFIEELDCLLERCITRRQAILPEREVYFPKLDSIIDYLDSYYELLANVYHRINKIDEAGLIEKGFLEDILNLDYVFQEDTGFALMTAPVCLEILRNIYDNINEYYTFSSKLNKDLRIHYRDVFIAKIIRAFRWYVVREGKVYHAAIPPYVPPEKIDNRAVEKLSIPIRPITKYNSYEGVGELRLLDKVMYELERRKNSLHQCQAPFRITIIGDINYHPMQEVCNILVHTFENDEEFFPLSFEFKVLTYNIIPEKKCDYETGNNKKISASYKFTFYESQLMNPQKVNELIEGCEVLFLLDCRNLYHELYVKEIEDQSTFWQRIATDTYNGSYTKVGGPRDLVRRGNFTDLWNVLTGYSAEGKPGVFRKTANSVLIEYFEKKCAIYNSQPEPLKKSIYAYVSDIAAFNSIYYSEKRFIRVEHYNEKDIGIVRFGQFDEGELKKADPEEPRIIVFNIWQLAKHIGVKSSRYLLDHFGFRDKMDVYQLKLLLVGVDYTHWPQKLRMSYAIDDNRITGYERVNMLGKLRNYLKNVVCPFFKQHGNDMYSRYFIKSIGSFLYSDAKNVDDMLFLHLFLNQHDKLIETELEESESTIILKYKSNKSKYSQKRFYCDIMREYDTSSSLFEQKYTKLKEIEKAGGPAREEIFYTIMDVCEQNQYGDSYLYQNCSKMLN